MLCFKRLNVWHYIIKYLDICSVLVQCTCVRLMKLLTWPCPCSHSCETYGASLPLAFSCETCDVPLPLSTFLSLWDLWSFIALIIVLWDLLCSLALIHLPDLVILLELLCPYPCLVLVRRMKFHCPYPCTCHCDTYETRLPLSPIPVIVILMELDCPYPHSRHCGTIYQTPLSLSLFQSLLGTNCCYYFQDYPFIWHGIVQ